MKKLQFVCSVVSRTKKSVKWLVKWQIISVDEYECINVGDLNLLTWATVVSRNRMLECGQQEIEKKLPVRRTGDLCWLVTDAEDKGLLCEAILAIAREWGSDYAPTVSVQIF